MHFICRSFIGSTNQLNWSQYWENEPDYINTINNKGHLFGLINLYSPDNSLDINQIGRQLIEDFNSSYFSFPDTISNSLNTSLETLRQSESLNGLSYRIIIVCVCKKTLYLVASPQTSAIICRQNKISHLVELSDQSSFISGPLLDQDLLFFSTAEFFNFITLEKIQNYLSSDNIQTIEENFISLLYSNENQDQKASFLIEVHHEQETELETESQMETSPKLEEKINNIFIKRRNPYQVTKRKRIYLICAILLLFILTFGIIAGYSKNKSANIQRQYLDYKNQVEEKLKNIEVVKNLSFDSAKEEIIATQKIVEKMNLLNINKNEISNYSSQLESLLGKTGSDSSFTPELFYEIKNIDDNLKFEQIISNQESLYLLDNENNFIYSLGYPDKNQNLIYKGEDKLGGITLALNNKTLYLLKNSGIFEVTKDKLISRVEFKQNIQPLDLAFWNSSLYILDKSQNTIYKYPPSASGFGSPQKWIKGSQKTENNSTSIAINGKIWVLSSDGRIQPFDRGDSVKFEISLPIETNLARNLSVTQKNDILVFHDNNFVYVFKKDGQGVAKYNFKDIKIIDIAINETSNLVFVLGEDQKIYKISL